jgi:hypothetical protein
VTVTDIYASENDGRERDDSRKSNEGAEKRPIEAWAEAKGMLPQMLDGPGGPRLNPEYWKFAAARAFKGWASDASVSEADFEAALVEQGSQVSR